MAPRRHLLAACLALCLALFGLCVAVPLEAPPAAAAGAKVVVIVGPVGSLTPYYRGLAAGAVAAAREAGATVVPLMSPDATWPAVRRALAGASIVVYLGHGWGHPSPYRTTLNPAAQDGLGLNPVGGSGDLAHQYFGERYIAATKLAPGAIVVMSHLCYASGNPEPGGPDPTLSTAEARVDNFAAGWLAAGAGAVIAEGHYGPAYYVRGLLAGRSAQDLWRRSPTFHGHVTTFASTRTKGAADQVDPDTANRGYFRSLVVARGAGLLPPPGAGDGGDATTAQGEPAPAAPPALAAGIRFGTPAASGIPVAGTAVRLRVAVHLPKGATLPEGLELGTRWSLLLADPLPPAPADGSDPAAVPEPVLPAAVPVGPAASPAAAPAAASPATTVPPDAGAASPATTTSPDPGASAASPGASPAVDPGAASPAATVPADAGGAASPGVASSPGPATSPGPGTSPGIGADPDDPPPVELIAAETAGLVTTAPATFRAGNLEVTAALPLQPGLYRLTMSLHDAEGVALEPAVQALLLPLVVHVTGAFSATYGVRPGVTVAADGRFRLRVRVTNTGSVAWFDDPSDASSSAEAPPRLVARWVALGDPADAPDAVAAPASTPAFVAPGTSALVQLVLTAPERAGDYLVVLDVVTPTHGSLAAAGVPPGTVHVVVQAGARLDPMHQPG